MTFADQFRICFFSWVISDSVDVSEIHTASIFRVEMCRFLYILSRIRGSVTKICGFLIWWIDLLDVSVTFTLDYNSSHIELLLDDVCLLSRCLVTLQLLNKQILSLSQPASLSWNKAPIWGLRPDLYYKCDSYGLVLVGRPLWREVGSVFCMCCWPLPECTVFYKMAEDLIEITASEGSITAVHVCVAPDTPVIPW
jgi:hypothetical protein